MKTIKSAKTKQGECLPAGGQIYALMYDNILVARTYIVDSKTIFRLEKDLPRFFLPIDLFSRGRQEVDMFEFTAWAEQRVVPANRVDAKKLLASLGMERYCAFEIAMKTRACAMEDGFWVAFSPHEDFRNITVRGEFGFPYIDLAEFKRKYCRDDSKAPGAV